MLGSWQDNFAHENMCISTFTLYQMIDYLESDQAIADVAHQDMEHSKVNNICK